MKKVQSNAHKTDEFFLAQSRDEQSDVKQFKRLKIMLKTCGQSGNLQVLGHTLCNF